MNENVEKIQNTKVGRGAASAANKSKVKRRLKHERHLKHKTYKGKVKRPRSKKVSKRLKNLLDGIPS